MIFGKKKWGRWDELKKSLQKGSKENQCHVHGVKDQVQDLQSSIAGFQNSLGGIQYSWKC